MTYGIGGGTDDLTVVVNAIERRPEHLEILRKVASISLPDSWVGAGFVRNAVWDDLHEYGHATPLADVDVVYFDAMATHPASDEHHEAKLRANAPNVPWSVKNQARMHLRNGDQVYESTAHALRCWPETCTALAARLGRNGVEILAPFGLRDLVQLVVRPTAHFAAKPDIYRERVNAKNWRERWPQLRIEAL
jgi:hypothetical protein